MAVSMVKLITLLWLITSPPNSQGHLIQNVINDIVAASGNDRGCSVDPKKEKIEWCHLANNFNSTGAQGNYLVIPERSVCAFHTLDETRCHGCYNQIWHGTSCDQDIFVPREKRLFIVFVIVSACLILCGGSRPSQPPQPEITCYPPNKTIYADRGKTSATVSWKSPTGKDGDSISPKQKDDLSGLNFEKGYHTITYTLTDSRGFKDFCYFTFEVRVHTCDPVPWPMNGKRTCEQVEMIWGKSCTITCDTGYTLMGYTLMGSQTLTCQRNEKYDEKAHVCKAKICPDLPTPEDENMFQCSDTTNYGSICKLSCKDGYRVSLPSYTTCTHDGTWSQPLPTCIDDSDPIFKNCPMNSIVRYADAGSTSTSVTYVRLTASDNSESFTLTLEQGLASGSLFSEGSTVVRYVAKDAAGNKGYCSFSVFVQVLTCSVPDYNDDNIIINCPSGYNLGSQCSISCRFNLPLKGASQISCERNESNPPSTFWSLGNETAPVCQTRPCPDLTPPRNGAIACDKWSGGEFCKMLCNSAYDIPRTVTASPNFLCGQSGRWTPNTVPDCINSQYPTIIRLPSKFYYYDGDCSTNMDNVKTNFLQALQSSSIWNTICPNPTDCTIDNVEVTCGPTARRKRSVEKREIRTELLLLFNISMKFEINGENSTTVRDRYAKKLKDLSVGIQADVRNGVYDDVAPGFKIRNDSTQFGREDFGCPKEGQVPDYATVSCRGCPTGTMYNSTENNCVDCPVGSYQDEDSSNSCKTCPPGTSTMTTGARNDSFCLEICSAGESSPTGLSPCSPCTVGSYQDERYSTTCKFCPSGKTGPKSAVSILNCTAYDTLLKGPVRASTNLNVTGDVEDLSFSIWFSKTKQPPSNFNVLLNIDRETSVNVDIYSAGFNVSIPGLKEIVSGLNLREGWNHMVLTWKQFNQQFSVYVGGELVEKKIMQFVNFPTISSNSSLHVIIPQSSEVQMRNLQLVSGLLDGYVVSSMSKACDSNGESSLVSLNQMKTDNENNINLIVPSLCDAVDECLSSPCGVHGTCRNKIDGFECKCYGGYTGVTCNTPPDYCISNGCMNGANCNNLLSQQTFNCTCTTGFKGKLCEIPKVNGGWGNWSEWSECSITCGGGKQSRSRICDNPPPDEDDGRPCEGDKSEMRTCNTQPCPICSSADLKRAFGASVKCEGTRSFLNCSVICRPGTVHTVEKPPVYTCRNGIWYPNQELVPCRNLRSPEILRITTKVEYPTLSCSNEPELRKDLTLKLQVSTCAGTSNGCKYDVKLEDCEGRRKRRETGTTVKIILTKDIPTGDLDIASYQINGTISPALRSLADAAIMLEKTGQTLKNSTDILSIKINDVVQSPLSVDITGETICKPGYIGDSGLCGECTAGTYQEGDICKPCDNGFYQDESATTNCKPCPTGWTTEYTGSTKLQHCSVRMSSTSPIPTMSSEKPEIESQNEVDLGIIVGAVVGTIVFLIIIAIAAAVIAKCHRSTKVKQSDNHIYDEPDYGRNPETDNVYLNPTYHGYTR